MLIRTWRHLVPCIQDFYSEREKSAMLRTTEKGKATAMKKAQEKKMPRKCIRECQQIAA